jgi:fatty acid/phospholipid biosynthesis enzyme
MGGDHGCGPSSKRASRFPADKRITSCSWSVRSPKSRGPPSRGFRDHRVRAVHASEILTMVDKPVAAVRKKKDC